ncbi:MAG: amidohydrolase family protein [Steroidobacteraceae bacterium]
MQTALAVIPRPPRTALPSGACDTHTHVFGPFDRYPLIYPPEHPMPLAPAEHHRRMLDAVGLDRCVLVQPTPQDTDVELMLHALAQAPTRLRAVAAARPTVSDSHLDAMHGAGVRGLRFVDAPSPQGTPRPGAVETDEIPALASRLAERGWYAHVWAKLPRLVEQLPRLLASGAPIVIEHMAMLEVTKGIADPGFRYLLGLLREGRIWMKLSVCRCSQSPPDYPDLRAFHDALVEANPERLLWGSDWPFIRMEGREPDVGALLDLFLDWIGDPVLAHQILVRNPARVFGFPDE